LFIDSKNFVVNNYLYIFDKHQLEYYENKS
jgi:hypothetical protein